MPPTTPITGYPKMAIVFAKLVVGGEERGTHPFLVSTSDAHGMCAGITSRRLPPRSGSSPLDYAITSFDHVHLPPSAFLGISLDRPDNRQALLHMYIWRIGVGSLSIPMNSVTASTIVACVGSDYSFRRHVQGKGTEKVAIISFRTQQLPILHATAVAYVLEAWRPWAVDQFMRRGTDPRVCHGVAVLFKATVSRLVTKSAQDVGERLGAQGTFGHNLVSQLEVCVAYSRFQYLTCTHGMSSTARQQGHVYRRRGRSGSLHSAVFRASPRTILPSETITRRYTAFAAQLPHLLEVSQIAGVIYKRPQGPEFQQPDSSAIRACHRGTGTRNRIFARTRRGRPTATARSV